MGKKKDKEPDDTMDVRRKLRKMGKEPVPEPDAERIWRKIRRND